MRWGDRTAALVVVLSAATGIASGYALSMGRSYAEEAVLPPELTPPPFRLPGGGRLTGVPYAPEGTRLSPEDPSVLRWAAAVERRTAQGLTTDGLRASAYLAAVFGDLPRSQSLLELALSQEPSNASLGVDLTALLLAEGRGERILVALEHGAAAAQQRYEPAGAHFNQGLVLLRLGLNSLASEEFRRELRREEAQWRQEAERFRSVAVSQVERQAKAARLLSRSALADPSSLREAVRSEPDLARKAFYREWSSRGGLDSVAADNLRHLGGLLDAHTKDILPKALAACLERGEKAERGRRLAANAEAALTATDLTAAADGFEQAEALFVEAGCPEAGALARTRRIVSLLRRGLFEDARVALPFVPARGGPYLAGWIESLRGWLAAERVDLHAIEQSYSDAAMLFGEASSFSEQGWMLGGVAWAQQSQGLSNAARETTAQALQATARSGNSGQLATVLEGAGELLNATWEPRAAALLLEQSLQIVNTQTSPAHRSGLHWTLAEGYYRSHRPSAALANLRSWRAELDQVRDPHLRNHHEALYAWAQARELAARDRIAAVERYSVALAQFQREDSRFGQTALLAERSHLLAATGRYPEAEADLVRGSELFEEQRRLLGQGANTAPFFSAAEGIFDSWVNLLAQQGRIAQAASVSDFGRARSLLDRLAARRGSFGARVRELGPKAPPPALDVPVLVLDQLGDQLFVAWIVENETSGHVVALRRDRASGLVRGALANTDTLNGLQSESRAELSAAVLDRAPAGALRSGLLLVVADDVYERLPFGSLALPDGRRLGDAVAISLVPSRRVAALLPSRPPALGRTMVRLVDSRVGADLLQPREQASPPRGSSSWRIVDLRPSLKERQLLTALEAADAIQFVTHGHADQNGDVQLLLRRADGRAIALGYDQIQALELRNSPVVLLGACYGANGPTVAQEGTRSLVRAFLAAGASQVMAAFGPVEDRLLRDYEARAVEELAANRPLPRPPLNSPLLIYGAEPVGASSPSIAASSMRQRERRH